MKWPISFICLVLCCLLLSGCWNYRGLDEIDIVTGIAVDKNESNGNYLLTFEIIDTQSGNNKGESSVKYVESKGETIFDAIRNAKKKLINKLYGGNMQTLIISKQIAETEGVSVILEEMLRDGEPRETLSITISQEETAKKILLTKGLDSSIISYEIHEMIEEDSRVTASTVNTPLYYAYNAIKNTGNALVLPVMRCTQNEKETVAEGNGIALFKKDRLQGFLPAPKTKFYLFLVDKIEGGTLSFPINNSNERVSMEIKRSKTNTNIDFKDGQLFVTVFVKVKLNVMEIKSQLKISQPQGRQELESLTEKFLQEHLADFFKEVQTQNKIDIFGLGYLIYQRNPHLWRSLEGHWDEVFQNADIQVQAEANIISSGVLKDY